METCTHRIRLYPAKQILESWEEGGWERVVVVGGKLTMANLLHFLGETR